MWAVVILVILVFILYKQPVFKNPRTKESKPAAAIIKCTLPRETEFNYGNIKDCRVAYRKFKNNYVCKDSCLGLKSCIKSCPENAITENLDVIYEKCTGCGICMEVCPVNLIKMVEQSEGKVYLSCNTSLKPEEVEEYCPKGCIKCYICVNVCPENAIDLTENGLPSVNFQRCTGCKVCVRKCPTEALKIIE
ncbi:MAG: 4Fe-4S binding protein [Elusimicrobiota bacterium]